MSDPQIEKLLIVQDRDIALQKIELELTRIPQERAAIEAQISAEESNIEAAGQALKEMEVQRHQLDTEVKAKEDAIAKFLTQQIEVKKNDEYRALTQQIEQNQKDISALEEQEIELMLEIDRTREAFEAEKETIEIRIANEKKQIEQLGQREQNLKASIDEAQSAVESSRKEAEPTFLEHYDRVKTLCKRPPYVAPIEAHKCGGCHLRVSNEVSHEAMNVGEPSFCDQCARMVFA